MTVTRPFFDVSMSTRAVRRRSRALALALVVALNLTLVQAVQADPVLPPGSEAASPPPVAEPVGGSVSAPEVASESAVLVDGDAPPAVDGTTNAPKGAPEPVDPMVPVFTEEPAGTDAGMIGETVQLEREGLVQDSEEVLGKRTATSQTFDNPDGSTSVVQYAQDTFMPDDSGELVPIDATVQPSGQEFVTAASPVQVTFAGDTDTDTLVSVSTEDGVIGFGVDDASPVEAVLVQDGAQGVSYPGILPEVDIALRPTPSGVKESIILASPQAPNEFSFPLTLDTGVKPVIDETGGVQFLNTNSEQIAAIPAGFMLDSSVGQFSGLQAYSWGVAYSLTETAAGWSLDVALDKAWLTDPGRVYPVLVDPTLIIQDEHSDTWIQQGSSRPHFEFDPTSPLIGPHEYLAVGPVPPDQGTGEITVSLLNIPLTQVTGKDVVSAIVQLDEVWSSSCTPTPVELREVNTAWDGSAVWPGPTLGAVLNTQTAAFGYGPGQPCSAPGVVNFNLDPVKLSAWANGTDDYYGFALTTPLTSSPTWYEWKKFASFDSPVAANAPRLVVTYAAEDATYAATALTSPTPTTAGGVTVNVTNSGTTEWAAGAGYKLGYLLQDMAGNPVGGVTPRVAVTAAAAATATGVLSIPALPRGNYQILLDMFRPDGASFHTANGTPYGQVLFNVANATPTILEYQPGRTTVTTLAPTLYLRAVDSDDTVSSLTYSFKICADQAMTVGCTQTLWSAARTFDIPPGLMNWGTINYWSGSVKDPQGAIRTVQSALTNIVPQPAIGSRLAAPSDPQGAPGLDPASGNYSASAVDAASAGVGPSISIQRTYNSADGRLSGAFGAGWSALIDANIKLDTDGSGNVVVTAEDGVRSRFGRTTTGTFIAPNGSQQQLKKNADNTYVLRSGAGNLRKFNTTGQITSLSDAAGHTITFTYTAGKVTRIQNTTANRGFTLTWVGGHVKTVVTDPMTAGQPGLTWTYNYTADQLTSVCSPEPATPCTTYTYTAVNTYDAVNRFLPTAFNNYPSSYWPLMATTTSTTGRIGDTFGSPARALLPNSAVTFSTSDYNTRAGNKSATFNGTNSFLKFSTDILNESSAKTIQLWFKTGTAGILMSAQDQEVGSATAPAQTNPVMYVGTDGKLRAGLKVAAGVTPGGITSAAAVNNFAWHLATLVVGGGRQTLYLDGVEVGNLPGATDSTQTPFVALGAGISTGSPAAPTGLGYFNGQISEVFLFNTPLSADQIAEMYTANTPGTALSRINLPESNRIYATITYNSNEARVATITDQNAAVWTLVDLYYFSNTTSTVRAYWPTRTIQYSFDRRQGNRPLSRTDSHGTQSWTYNGARLQSKTEENGFRTDYLYDTFGNTTGIKTGFPTAPSTATGYAAASYFWNTADPLDSRNGARLATRDARTSDSAYNTTNTIDAIGNVVTTTYPRSSGQTSNPVVTNTYSVGTEAAVGGGTIPPYLLIRTVGARGQLTDYKYRSNGDLAETVYPSGLVVKSTYDGLGRKLTKSQYNGATLIGTTTFTYDQVGRLVTTTAPVVTNAVTGVQHQLRTETVYDKNGNPLTVTTKDVLGNDPNRVTTFTYNARNQPITVTTPDGQTTTRNFALTGDLDRSTAPDGTITTNFFDDRHLKTKTTIVGPNTDPLSSAGELVTEVNQYDPAGLLANTTNAAGQRIEYTYGTGQQLATATAKNVLNAVGVGSDIVLQQNTYDAGGYLATQTSRGLSTAFSYDRAGNIAATTQDPAGLARATNYLYDPDRNPVKITRTGAASPGVIETTDYTYDTANQLLTETVYGNGADRFTTTTARDPRGLPTAITDPAGTTTTLTYNALGVQTSAAAPSMTTFDGINTVIVVPKYTLGYNTFGDQTESKDPKNKVTKTTFDTSGRPLTTTLPTYTPVGGTPLVATSTATYNNMGWLTESPRVLRRAWVNPRASAPGGFVDCIAQLQLRLGCGSSGPSGCGCCCTNRSILELPVRGQIRCATALPSRRARLYRGRSRFRPSRCHSYLLPFRLRH